MPASRKPVRLVLLPPVERSAAPRLTIAALSRTCLHTDSVRAADKNAGRESPPAGLRCVKVGDGRPGYL